MIEKKITFYVLMFFATIFIVGGLVFRDLLLTFIGIQFEFLMVAIIFLMQQDLFGLIIETLKKVSK